LPYGLTVSLVRYVTYTFGVTSIIRAVSFVTSRCPIMIAQYKHKKEKDHGKSHAEHAGGHVQVDLPTARWWFVWSRAFGSA